MPKKKSTAGREFQRAKDNEGRGSSYQKSLEGLSEGQRTNLARTQRQMVHRNLGNDRAAIDSYRERMVGAARKTQEGPDHISALNRQRRKNKRKQRTSSQRR